jgi:hypothetical protein
MDVEVENDEEFQIWSNTRHQERGQVKKRCQG